MALFCRTCARLLAQGPKAKHMKIGTCRWCGSTAGAIERQRGAPRALKAKVLRDAECVACGTRDNLTVDHIVPMSKGGTHDLSNLQAMCETCNNAKGCR